MAGLRVLVPYNAQPGSERGLEVAFRLAASAKSSMVYAVFVVEVERRLPVDAEMPAASEEGERRLREAEALAGRYKARCQGQILQARDAGLAIVDEAAELDADAIVMGVAEATGEGTAIDLGKTADYVLRHALCTVIIVRDEAGEA